MTWLAGEIIRYYDLTPFWGKRGTSREQILGCLK
jgi:hypothetical protein